MTDVYGPFDAAPGDPRLWTQDQWYRHAPKWAPSGVNGSPAASTTTGDLPLSFSGLSPTIGTGRAWVRGSGFERTAPSGLPALPSGVPVNTNLTLFRRDRIVLRRDLAAKTVAPTLIQGTPASSPSAPSIQQNETGQWDLPQFSFLVPPNSGTTITSVVDERLWLDSSSGDMSARTKAQLDAMATAGITFVDGKRIYTTSDGRYWRWDAASSSWLYAGGNPPPISALSINTGAGGWAAGAGFAPGCYKDASGEVNVVGGVTNSGSYTPGGQLMMVLPAGFWPTKDIAVEIMVAAGSGIVLGGVYAADGGIRANYNNSVAIGAGLLHTVNFKFHPKFAGGSLA